MFFGYLEQLKIGLRRLDRREIVLWILGSPRVVEAKGFSRAGFERLEIESAFPWQHLAGNETHCLRRGIQVSAISGNLSKRSEKRSRGRSLRNEVAKLAPRLQIFVIPERNYTARQLMLHQKIVIRTDKRENFSLSVGVRFSAHSSIQYAVQDMSKVRHRHGQDIRFGRKKDPLFERSHGANPAQ